MATRPPASSLDGLIPQVSPQFHWLLDTRTPSQGVRPHSSDSMDQVVYVKLCNFRFMAEGVIG